MADRKNKFLLKRSNVAGKVPSAGDLLLGEMALNTADVILYTSGTTANSILPIGWDRIHRTGDTMTGTLFAPSLSATTMSATTYYGDGSNLTGIPDIYTTAATFNYNTLELVDNDGTLITAEITNLTGVTFDGLAPGDSRLKHWIEIYETGNVLVTNIPSASTPVKVNTTSKIGGLRGFSASTSNRVGYTATTTGQTFVITGTLSAEAASGSQIFQFMLYKNGVTEVTATIIETELTSSRRAVAITGTIGLTQGDYLELWTQNNTSNKNLEVYDFNLTISQI